MTENDAFQTVNEGFFDEHGSTNPLEAATAWCQWLGARRRNEAAKLRKILELGSGVSDSGVRHFLKGRRHKLSEETLRTLEAIYAALGYQLQPRHERESGPPRGPRRISLLTELTGIPSEAFHLSMIRALTRACGRRHFLVGLHEVSPHDLEAAIRQITNAFRPQAVVLLRLTPDANCLRPLRDRHIPTVLVHGHRLTYPPPVLVNVIPRQEPIVDLLRDWAERRLRDLRSRAKGGRRTRKVVVAGMQPELTPRAAEQFGLADGVEEASIRKHRRQLIMKALQGVDAEPIDVDDYSFLGALKVFKKRGNAAAYVCLSDQLAVGIKHLLLASGTAEESGRGRHIIGFDNSDLARREEITSFDQNLDTIGEVVADTLDRWFQEQPASTDSWPRFQEMPVEIHLALRD